MTLKQKFILGGIVLGVSVGDTSSLIFSHFHPNIFSFVYSVVITAMGFYAVGGFEWKWKRDKEMASIVAERLMGKPRQDHISYPWAQDSVHFKQQLAKAAMLGFGGQSGASTPPGVTTSHNVPPRLTSKFSKMNRP